MTTADLDALESLARAQCLPWWWKEGVIDDIGDPVFVNSGRGSGDPTEPEAAYLVAAANAVPGLVAELRAARAERDRLRDALRPFAEYVEFRGVAMPDDTRMDSVMQYGPTLGHCRAAAALLAAPGEG